MHDYIDPWLALGLSLLFTVIYLRLRVLAQRVEHAEAHGRVQQPPRRSDTGEHEHHHHDYVHARSVLPATPTTRGTP